VAHMYERQVWIICMREASVSPLDFGRTWPKEKKKERQREYNTL